MAYHFGHNAELFFSRPLVLQANRSYFNEAMSITKRYFTSLFTIRS